MTSLLYFLRFRRIYAPDTPSTAAVTSAPQGVKVGMGRGPFLVPAIELPQNIRKIKKNKTQLFFILFLLYFMYMGLFYHRGLNIVKEREVLDKFLQSQIRQKTEGLKGQLLSFKDSAGIGPPVKSKPGGRWQSGKTLIAITSHDLEDHQPIRRRKRKQRMTFVIRSRL